MPEEPKVVPSEAQAQRAPKQEAEGRSVEELRDALLEKADDSVEGIRSILQMLEGTDFSKQALEIREKAGDKREELKAALEDLLAQKTRGSILGVDSQTAPKAKTETPILVGADGKKYGGEETEIPPVIFGADGKAAAEKKEPTPDELVGASENWDDLINAVTQIGEIVGSDGKVYKAEEINSFLNLIKEQEARGMMFTSKSPLLVSLTRTHGLRSKVIELLDKSEAKAAAVLGPDGKPARPQENEAAVVFGPDGRPATVEEAPQQRATEEKKAEAGPALELPEIQASIEELKALLAQIEEAYRTPSGNDFSMRAEALNRAAQILENPEYQGVVLRRDKDGGPIDTESMKKAYAEAEAQLRKKEKDKKEAGAAEKAAAERAEREKALRALIDELNRAVQLQNREAKLAGLKRAAEVLDDPSFAQAILGRDKDGGETVNEAIERAVLEAERLLRGGKKKGEEEPPGGGGGEQPPGGGGGEQPPGGGGGEQPPGGGGGEQPPGGGGGEQPPGGGGGEQPPGGGGGEQPPGGGGGEQPPGGGDGEQPPGGGGGEQPKSPIQTATENYAAAKAKLFKGYGGILGVIRRLNRSGYAEAKAQLEAAAGAYEQERNKLVLENVNNFVGTELELANQTRDRMAETKRLPGISWAYDQWKKLGKARLAGALVLGGVGVAAMLAGGGILGVGAGAIAGGVFVGRKIMTLGGLTTGFGTYETLTKVSYGGFFGKGGEAPKIPLANNRATELAEWDKTYRKTNRVPGGAALFLRGMTNTLSNEQKQVYAQYQAQRRALETRLNEEQLAEGGVQTLSDEKLDEGLAYFGAEMPFRGMKPDQDPTYVAFLKEKARRMRDALEASDEKGVAGVEQAKARLAREEEAVKQEKVNEQLSAVKDYCKQWYLTEYRLLEKMKGVQVEGATEEEREAARRATPEYAEWEAAKAKMQERLEALPEDVQVIISRAGGDQRGSRTGLRELLAGDTAAILYEQNYRDVEPDAVWGANWQLNPAVQSEVESLIRNNEALMQSAVEEARERMKTFVTEVENQERQREAIRVSVMDDLEKKLNEHDVRVEEMTKTAVRKDAYRKLVAAAITAASVSLAFLNPEPIDSAGKPPQPDETPKPPVPVEDDGGITPDPTPKPPVGPEPEPAPVPVEPEPITPEVEPTVVDVEQFREGNGILHCVNRLQADNPEIFKDMTPEEIHNWRIDQLKELGFKFKGGKWGYPNMPMWNEGSDTSFGGVQLIEGPDGPSIQLVQTDGAGHAIGTIDKSGVLTDMDGDVIGRIDGRGALREINQDGSLGDKITEIDGQPYKTGFKFHDDLRWRDAAPGRGVRGAELAEALKADEAQAQMVPDTTAGAEAAPDTTGGAEAAPDATVGAEAAPDTTGGAEAVPDTAGGSEAAPDTATEVNEDGAPESTERQSEVPVVEAPSSTEKVFEFNSEHVRGARLLIEEKPGGTTIRMEGGVVGVGQGELIDQGILKEDFMQTLMEKRPNGLGMSRDIVMSDARNILMYKEAAKALAEAGRQADADMVLRQVERMTAMVERRYGDVLQ